MHVASKLISPCPSGVTQTPPILESPFQSSCGGRGCEVLPPAASPCTPECVSQALLSPLSLSILSAQEGEGLSLPGWPVCLWDPEGQETAGRNAGLWRRLATGLLKGPRQSCGFITLPPCLRVSTQPHFHNRIFCRPEKSG